MSICAVQESCVLPTHGSLSLHLHAPGEALQEDGTLSAEAECPVLEGSLS